MGKIATAIQKTFIGLIKGYQILLSPFTVSRCRFYPTCSEYSLQAIKIHGPFKGIILSVKRIFRCHPFHSGGIDHVPEKKD